MRARVRMIPIVVIITMLGILLTVPMANAQDERFEIKLKSRRFIPDPTTSIDLPAIPQDADGTERHHVMLQFDRLPATGELAGLGIKVLNYVPNNTVIASIPAGFNHQSIANIRWMGRLAPVDKISPIAAEQLRQNPSGSFTFVVEAFGDVPTTELESIIRRAGGRIDTHPAFPTYVRLVTGPATTFYRLADNETIAWIMPASTALINKAPVYFCPGPMTPFGPIPNFVAHDNGWDGPGRGSASLTYHFLNGTPDISGTTEEIEVERAFAEWAKYAQISFTEANTGGLNKSLDIWWVSGEHGDGSPFDGAGPILAHAFFPAPPNPESLAGDIHLDEDENWSVTADFHQFTVALHEAGHALGLDHSDVSDAVMYAIYRGPVTGLHPDDIAGIQFIYAAPTTPVDLVLQNITVNIGETVSWEATNSITVAGDTTTFTIVGNGSSGGQATFKVLTPGGTIRLRPGFRAQQGSTCRVHIVQ